jgi:cyclic beta-1,2-glucan synthetase
LLRHAALGYLGVVASLTVGLVALLVALLRAAGMSWPILLLSIPLALIAASELAVTVANCYVTWLLPPRLLPKLSLKQGIPSSMSTMVVVPVLLDSAAGIEQMLEDLEVRALANLEENLYFALLTDHVDAETEHHADDEARLALARQGIEALNQRYPNEGSPRFHLFHRRRLQNAAQGVWMGWERKRGKLEELNQLLMGREDTTYDIVTASPKLLRRIRFVITLDADTQLPRDTARRLVSAIAHPLNRPRVKHMR